MATMKTVRTAAVVLLVLGIWRLALECPRRREWPEVGRKVCGLS
jgi:hypothetical protein